MEQYTGQLEELISLKIILNSRYQNMLRQKALYETEFQSLYKKIDKAQNFDYWKTKAAVASSTKMKSLQKQYSQLKKQLTAWNEDSKTIKDKIRSIQIERSNLAS